MVNPFKMPYRVINKIILAVIEQHRAMMGYKEGNYTVVAMYDEHTKSDPQHIQWIQINNNIALQNNYASIGSMPFNLTSEDARIIADTLNNFEITNTVILPGDSVEVEINGVRTVI